MSLQKQVKALWQQCFNDTPQFVEFYFTLRYKEERNIAIPKGNRVVAALQLLPYSMTFCGVEIPTAYVSGACTHPDYRNQGIMKELLARAFRKMHDEGILLSTLIPAEPWLFDYYARLGYAAVFRRIPTACTPNLEATPKEIEADSSKKIYPFLSRHWSTHPCCILHSPEDFAGILMDMVLSGARIPLIRYDASDEGSTGELAALAILYPDGNGGWRLEELLADTPEAEAQLREYIHARPLSEEEQPFGMARIIRAPEFLQRYAAAHPEASMDFLLTDGQLPANNGYYHINKGVCTHSSTDAPANCRSLSINELTELLLRPMHPHMSLMLN